jgi:hypothetical protein
MYYKRTNCIMPRPALLYNGRACRTQIILATMQPAILERCSEVCLLCPLSINCVKGFASIPELRTQHLCSVDGT